jgi:uncharacterized membrane protein YidH (DUF202 family)
MSNYKAINQIYCNDEDQKRAMRSIPVTAVYILLLFAGIGITGFLFEVKGIENNTAPAMKLCGLLLVGVAIATAGFFLENSRIKKWKPANEKYNSNIFSIVSLLLCVIAYGLMFIV